jgi:hypothetical protein
LFFSIYEKQKKAAHDGKEEGATNIYIKQNPPVSGFWCFKFCFQGA